MTNKEPNIDLLIKRECKLIKQGGDASVLADLMKEQQYSIYKDSLTSEERSIYFSALLISNRFYQLKFACERVQKIQNQKQNKLFHDIAEQAINENFAKAILLAKELQLISTSEMKNQFAKSIKKYTIRTLSRDYINIGVDFLQKNYQIKDTDLRENGCIVEGKFAKLPSFRQIKEVDELLECRIKQLSTITESVIRKGNA